MQILTAYTTEIDNVDLAVEQIVQQLDLSHRLASNAVGILSCYSEFIDTGVVQALCACMPFDIIGATTLASAVPGLADHLALTLTVITGEDIRCSTGRIDSVDRHNPGPIAHNYRLAAAQHEEKPTLALVIMPIDRVSGWNQALDVLDTCSGGVTLFGMVAADHTSTHLDARVISCGEAYVDSMAFALFSGNIETAYHLACVPTENIRQEQAIVTAAEGSLLKEINDIPALQHLQLRGLLRDNPLEGIKAIPFIVDYNDGTPPVARTLIDFTSEGYAVCGGSIPVNATLSIASLDYDDVLKTATQAALRVLKHPRARGVLLFSCVSRNMALGFDSLAELESINEAFLGHRLPFHMCYSGGEFCPVRAPCGRSLNRFHNDAIIACVFSEREDAKGG